MDPVILRNVPLFAAFDDAQLQEVAALCTFRTVPKQRFIVREGERGETLFIIVSGSVAVLRETGEARETILSILKDRDFFGEMSLFDSSPRSASIRTIVETKVAQIERRDFLALLERSPRIGTSLVVALSQRLRAANDLIASTTSQDIRSRLATLLLNLMESFGEESEGGTRIGLKLTNLEMANMIGTTRETVNRTLNKFWDERVIDMRTSYIIVTHPDRLKSLSP